MERRPSRACARACSMIASVMPSTCVPPAEIVLLYASWEQHRYGAYFCAKSGAGICMTMSGAPLMQSCKAANINLTKSPKLQKRGSIPPRALSATARVQWRQSGVAEGVP